MSTVTTPQKESSFQETLATSYEGINLFEDALQQYNELESAFMQVLREKNMSWFGSLIHPVPNDDSMPLLSTSKKHYRDLILANTISVFDLRVYILSRQSALLSKLRQPSEICWKAFTFLTTFGKHLRAVEVGELIDVFNNNVLMRFSSPRFPSTSLNLGHSLLLSAFWTNAIHGLLRGQRWMLRPLHVILQGKEN